MKMEIQCMRCFMKQAVKAAKLSTPRFPRQIKALKKAAAVISDLNPSHAPPQTATRIFKNVAKETGCPDPFASLKKESNTQVKKILPAVKKAAENSADPFSSFVKISLSGNIIDHGILDDFDIEGLLKKEMNELSLVPEIGEIKERVLKATSLVFVADNAGEIAFDSLMLEEFKKINPNLNIIIFVKNSPIINDATAEDAAFFSIDKKFKIERTPSTVGLHINLLSPRHRSLLEKTDIIVAKGQANYEMLSEENNPQVIFMLRAKCPVVARALNVEEGTPVILQQ